MDLGLRPDDRVLVLGSSGWLGREFTELLPSETVTLAVPGPSSGCSVDDEEIASFSPTIVANFAFLTRERVETEGEVEFERINQGLIDRFLRTAQLPTVRSALTISSGAAVAQPDHPYGRLKAREEEEVAAIATSSRSVVIARTYSISGSHVRRPRDYAFSDFVLQAKSGSIQIRARGPVWRRYCSAPDVLSVAMRSANAGRSGLFETGGPLVEVGELARAVVDSINPDAPVRRDFNPELAADAYHSDNRSWEEWCHASGVEPIGLATQIELVAATLTLSPHSGDAWQGDGRE